jgi:hypothetical protein
MNVVPVLFVGALAYLVFSGGDVLSSHGPFEDPPPGTDSKPLSVDNVKASSGNAYRVTAFRRASASQILYVAQRSDGSKDWVSYVVNTSTKQRTLYRADGESPEAISVLRKDFGL